MNNLTSVISIPVDRIALHLKMNRGLVGNPGHNETWRIDWGRVGVDADRLIGIATDWQLQGDPGAWIWRRHEVKTSYINPPNIPKTGGGGPPKPLGMIPSGPVRDLTYAYDAAGNLLDAYGALSNTLPLQRSHEDPSAKYANNPPSGASTNGLVHLQHRALDAQGEGNIILVQNPDNRCTHYVYDSVFRQLPTQRIVATGQLALTRKGIDPYSRCGTDSLVTTVTYDRGFSQIVQTVDPNGATSTASYDAFGRITEAHDSDPNSPQPNALANFTADYFVHAGLPIRVHMEQRLSDLFSRKGAAGPYRERWDYFDGLGRHLATLSSADPDAGDSADWVVSGRTAVSANGYVVRAYQPAFYPGDPSTFDPRKPPNPAPNFTGYSYDQFGRLSDVAALDGTPALKIDHAGLKDILWDADNLDPASPHANLPTTVLYDGHGRVIEIDRTGEAQSQPVTVVDKWVYEATGEIDSFQRAAPGAPTYIHQAVYDTLGRMVESREPNSLRWNFFNQSQGWRYAYNDAGQLVGTSDPRGCGEDFYYDTAGRVVGEDYSPCRKSQPTYSPPTLAFGLPTGDGAEVLYIYDANEAGDSVASAPRGRLTAVLDRAAHMRIHYDMRGRVTNIQRQVAVPNAASLPHVADRYTQHWFDQAIGYDEAGEITSQSTGADVPELLDASGNSIITAQYSSRGLLSSVNGSYGPFLASATYDETRLPLHEDYGGVATAHFLYDTLRRLHEKIVRASDGPPFLLEDSVFTYDRVGNPVEIDDNRNAAEWPEAAKPTSRGMQYDHMYRLLNIGYSGGADKFQPSSSGLANGLPDSKADHRVGFQSFNYDALGNTTQTSDDANVFFDRSLGTIQNGGGNGILRVGPNALSSASNGTDFLAAHYDGGNLIDLVVQRTAGCTATSPSVPTVSPTIGMRSVRSCEPGAGTTRARTILTCRSIPACRRRIRPSTCL